MKVYIKPECYAEIQHYVAKSSVEISGLGRIQKASDGSMVVTSVYLLKQENGPASTDIDPEAMSSLLYETRNDPGDLNFWWHSHVNMNVFWSGTDMDTITDFGSKGYLLSTVFNKKGEYRTAYYQAPTGFLPHVFVDDIDTEFGYIPTADQAKIWDTNYDTLCTEKKWAVTTPGKTWDNGIGPGVTPIGAAGIGDDGSIPHAWRDPYYWRDDIPVPEKKVVGKYQRSKAPELSPLAVSKMNEVVGLNTGLTAIELSKEIWKLRKFEIDIRDLDQMSQFILFDLFEISNGFEADNLEEVEYLYAFILESPESCNEIIQDFWDSIEGYIPQNKEPLYV